jgi:hypothetical protein
MFFKKNALNKNPPPIWGGFCLAEIWEKNIFFGEFKKTLQNQIIFGYKPKYYPYLRNKLYFFRIFSKKHCTFAKLLRIA